MMPYNVNDILKLRFMGTVNGEAFQLVQHFRAKQAIVSVVDFGNALTQGFLVELRAIMTESTRFISVGHVCIKPDRGDEEDELPIVPVVGTRQVHSMPNQIATLLKTRTRINDPWHRGRMYVPGMPQDHFTNGGFSQLAVVVMQSTAVRLAQWVKEGGDNAWLEMGVVSRITGAPQFEPLTNIEVATYPATMRSRRPTST